MTILILKVTLLLSIGLAAASLARRARAATRHALLASSLAATLLVPIVSYAVPDLTVPIRVPGRVASLGLAEPPAVGASTAAGTAPSATTPASTAPPAPSSAWPLERALLALWALGAALIAAITLRDLWLLGRLRRCGLPWMAADDVAGVMAATAGLRRSITLVTHEAIQTPFTLGWLRPTIMLPPAAAAWDADALRRALVHEIEHVRRHDWPVQLLARAACIAFWFHPLSWVALRRLVLEAERACDDAVLTSCDDETGYAEQLVGLARSATGLQPGLTMAARGDLAARVTAILDATQARGRAGARACGAAAAGALLLVAAITPLRAVAAPDAADAPVEAQAPRRPGFAAGDLMRAAGRDDVETLRELLAAGADANGAVPGDGSPLIAAARAGSLESVRVLLNAGANPSQGVPGDGNPLIAAASNGYTAIVAALLERGARIDEIVPGDENALIAASAEGHLEVVRLLVSRGADVNARAWSGPLYTGEPGEWRTPLSRARASGHDAVAAFLIASGATR